MMLTFLNLIAVSGILVGLIAGAEVALRESAVGDIIIEPLDDEDRILETPALLSKFSSFPEITAYSVRYNGAGTLEANYKERRDLTGERDTAALTVTGIDPVLEDKMTNLSDLVVKGEYLDPNEEGKILIGIYYLEEYAELYGDLFDTVENVNPGDIVRVSVGEVSKEFEVKGIVESKVDEVNFTTFIPEREFRRLFNRIDRNADQIVVRVVDPAENATVKDSLIDAGVGELAEIKTYEENVPKFLADIKNTFDLLGAFIGSIGLIVASITIFIIIFINALSRRQQIGILKGIGIDRVSIEVAYVLQAAFYALVGSALGALITYGFLIGYLMENPIDFPFSDGIMVADPISTLYRFVTLFIITLFAGFIPAWMIVRQNTLNSILGRK
tara:strand:+ start:3203 stop:4363 length:1161 start_codon:yes stop_codon:yes gene_type:complete